MDIESVLNFQTLNQAQRRIEELEFKNSIIVRMMHDLSVQFRQTLTERDLYLCVHQVRSGTVYIRWRKRGVNGNQPYLMMASQEGVAFLNRQTEQVRALYEDFDLKTLQLNLAYSIHLFEAKRIGRFLEGLSHRQKKDEVTNITPSFRLF